MNLFLLTSLLYVALAILGAVDAASASLNLLPWFNGLRWLRVHLITLGVTTEAVFGFLPIILASRAGRPSPPTRLDIWLTLNAGLLTLLVGIPLVNQGIIIAGGGLIFIATALLIQQLWQLRRPSPGQSQSQPALSRRFYLVGLGYFLLGIFVGTGLWLGWNQTLGMRVPIEVHIHANNWGLLSFVFAGLITDLYPQLTGQSLAWPGSINRIFWLMFFGAFALVLGPWTGLREITAPGILMHLVATIWLLLNVLIPFRRERKALSIGFLHIVTSYIWLLAPVMVAPLVLFEVPGIPGAVIEQNAPQALIYGWVLQFSYAIVPYLFTRVFLHKESAKLGGSWFSLATVHLGGLFLWLSIFISPAQAPLHGIAYALWSASMVPFLAQLWKIMRQAPAVLQGSRGL
jgi:hypothetical protein